tara:strand:+ start:169 stop:405 length:237 start_codon:yes stop_codon:yes gene_type:complete
MKINLNQTMISLCDAYHAGKLTKAEYRSQRSKELERISGESEEFSRSFSNSSGKCKKHIMLSGVLFIFSIFIVIVLLV